MTPTEIVNSDAKTFWRWFNSSSPQKPGVKRRNRRERTRANQQLPRNDILLLVENQSKAKGKRKLQPKPNTTSKQVQMGT